MINEQKLKDFKSFLETTSLEKCDKDNFLFLIDYLSGKHIPKLASRSFLIHGEPGVGKTHIVEKFIGTVDIPIIFAGYTPIRHQKLVHCQNLEEIAEAMAKHKECLVFLDDLGYVFQKDDCGEVQNEDKRQFMQILENIKAGNSVLIATINSFGCLDEPMIDRMDVQIGVDLPTEDNRFDFFNKEFSEYLNKKNISFLSKSTFGYNYRDIPELVKMAYRLGNGKITLASIKSALKSYTPASLSEYQIVRHTGLNFNHVIGKDNEKNTLKRMIRLMKNRQMAKRLGINRPNFIIFHGPPGTGKTYLAKALSGEMCWPMLSVCASQIYSPRGALASIKRILDIGRRFRNCIIFIDEAEKLLAREFMGDDTPLQGALQSELDGMDAPISSLVILAMNDIERFGEPIKDRFNMIEFGFPNKEDRSGFLMNKMKKAKYLRFEADISSLVSMTENLSFRAIEKAWNGAAYHFMDTKEPITEEMFSNCIKQANRRSRMEYQKCDYEMFG